jgi:PEP-CTERM motif-containing protein
MRYLRVLWMLPVLLLAHTAEAARISFATENCGTPPLLGLEFGIDENGTSVLLDSTTNGCPTPFNVNSVIPGDVGTSTSPLYGTSITNIDLTISSTQALTADDFSEGNFFDNDISFDLSFTPFTGGGGVLSVTFLDGGIDPFPCSSEGELVFCLNLDLLLHIDESDDFPLSSDTIVQVTRVNDQVLPEPATLSLLGVGLAVAIVRRRRPTATKAWMSPSPSVPDTADRT